MQISDLEGVLKLPCSVFEDERGFFSKVYHRGLIEEAVQGFRVQEVFFSVSKKNVVRGMHYQAPPYHQRKIIFCSSGRIQNVLLDLRSDYQTYGAVASFEIGQGQGHAVLVPSGVANGFRVLSDYAVVHYITDCVYVPSADCGVHWNSIAFPWGISEREAIVSDRDRLLPKFCDLQSPF